VKNVYPNLWVGPYDESFNGFDVIYLLAPEVPATKKNVVRIDASDQPPYEPLIQVAMRTAERVDDDLRQRRRVALCCREGLNRSALVAAIYLARFAGYSGPAIMVHLRNTIGDRALYNETLATYVRGL
jgi:hypothetical protein